MGCFDKIVPIAARIIESCLQFPPEDLFEEVEVPLKSPIDKGVSISYLKKRRIRYNLVHRDEFRVQFLSSANEVGEILAQHYDLTSLVRGAGLILDTERETAGGRFLGHLINSVIGGVETLPPITPTLRRICKTFEAQVVAGEVAVRWIYPIPGLTLIGELRLSSHVSLEDLGEKRLELLNNYAQGGLTSINALLQTTTVLAIRTVACMPFGHTGHENSDIIHKVVLSFVLSDLPPPLFLTSWPEPLKESVFELGGASWFAPWSASPLAFFPQLNLTPSQSDALKRVYKAVASCPGTVLDSMPVRRAISATHRNNYEDKVIDLWTALESLLLRDDENTELQYRMAFRAAWIVRPPDFRSFEKEFKKAYTERSKVVHGARHKIKAESLQRYEWGFALLKRIIIWSIQSRCLPDTRRIEEAMVARRPSSS